MCTLGGLTVWTESLIGGEIVLPRELGPVLKIAKFEGRVDDGTRIRVGGKTELEDLYVGSGERIVKG